MSGSRIQTTKYETSAALSQASSGARGTRYRVCVSRPHLLIALVCLAVTVALVLVSAHKRHEGSSAQSVQQPQSQQQVNLENTMKDRRRFKRSPLVSSSSTFAEGSTGPASLYLLSRYNEMNEESAMNDIGLEPQSYCRKRSLPMCRGHVPFNSTTYPNFIGDSNELEASRSLPYFNYIAKSRCNRRIKQLLCSFLEPDCQNGRPIPPCKKFCRIALEGCAEFVPQTLELSAAFDCRRYPDSTDPRVCTNLALGPKCAADEFQCPDRSCIPNHWVCDGVRDCIFAADEANCNTVGQCMIMHHLSFAPFASFFFSFLLSFFLASLAAAAAAACVGGGPK